MLLALVLFALLPGAIPTYAVEKLVLNTGLRDPFTTNAKDGFIDLIVRETFRRIGIDAEIIIYQNSVKSLQNSNNGIDDGAALHIKGLEKRFSNLMRVPEKLIDYDFIAYSTDQSLITDSWTTLDGFNIAYIKGWQIFQNNLPDHPSVARTRTAQQMFDLLSNGDVDIMLYERWQGLWRAQQLDIKIRAHSPPLAKRGMFMYLNKKHSGLVEKAAAALLEMKKDGTHKAIFDKTLGQLEK
jgi:polar amino acid transport system substrate-binding protein